MNGHLDPLALDAVRAGEASPEERDHAARCPDCGAAVEGLKTLASRLAPPRVDVPDAIRRAVLARAGAELRKRGRRRVWTPLAAAAALLLAVLAGAWLARSPAVPGDVDRSGSVDILDAYALAARLKAGGRPDPRWDLNGDGVVDRRDVDAIGALSVSITRRRS